MSPIHHRTASPEPDDGMLTHGISRDSLIAPAGRASGPRHPSVGIGRSNPTDSRSPQPGRQSGRVGRGCESNEDCNKCPYAGYPGAACSARKSVAELGGSEGQATIKPVLQPRVPGQPERADHVPAPHSVDRSSASVGDREYRAEQAQRPGAGAQRNDPVPPLETGDMTMPSAAFRNTVISVTPLIRRSGLTKGPRVSWIILVVIVLLLAVSAYFQDGRKGRISTRTEADMGSQHGRIVCDDKALHALWFDPRAIATLPFLIMPEIPEQPRLLAEQSPNEYRK